MCVSVCVKTCHTRHRTPCIFTVIAARKKNPIKRHGVPCISNVIAARIFHRPRRSVLQRCHKYSNVKKKILYLVTLYSKCTRAQRHSTLPQILKSKRRKLKRQRPNSSTLTTCLLSQNRGGFFVLELSACWRVFATIWHRSGSRVSGLGFWVSGLVLRSACWRELATVWHSFLFYFLGAEQLCAQCQACS